MEDYLKTKGRIFDIQRYSIHDGNGIRTIVFLKGCVLRCRWCCNPESQEYRIQTMTVQGKPKVIGRDVTVGEVMETVVKDRPYYRRTGGGMTLSGGESLCQPEFARDLLRAAKESGISTAMESMGYAGYDVIREILPYLDQYLMDIKHMDPEKHREFTGKRNDLMLENAKKDIGKKYGSLEVIGIKPECEKRNVIAICKCHKCGSISNISLSRLHSGQAKQCAKCGRKNLETDFHITPEDIMVFADFSKPGINSEIEKLRAVTNTIIETQQAFNRHKKDMTDFIMLDFIYQTAAQRKDINTYILFTGDGHFQSVVKYLIQRLKKEVIVFGVKDAVSNRLKDVASEYHEIPYPSEMKDAYYRMIVSNMDYVFDKPEIIPTFMSTVQAVSERNRIPESNIYSALNEMIDEGLIYKREQTVNFNRVKVIAADWDALKKAGYWDPEKKQER